MCLSSYRSRHHQIAKTTGLFALSFSLMLLCSPLYAATKALHAKLPDHYHSLLTRAKDQGRLAVIIEYQTGVQSRRSSRLQRHLRQNTENQLLQKLSRFRPQQIKRFKHADVMAMQLSSDGLEMAMRDPQIKQIYEDKLSRPSLQSSAEIVAAPEVARSGFSGQGQTIAILDTGIEASHSFLIGKVVHEACFSQTISSQGSTTVCPNGSSQQIGLGAARPCLFPDCDHGTHVAGIAAGKGNGFSGIAAGANLISIQVFSRFTGNACAGHGSCILSYTSDQIRALEHIYSLRNTFNIAAVNLSLGDGERHTTHCDGDPRKGIIDLLRSAGIATIAAAGNETYPNGISSPACISSVISVGSTSKQDIISYSSNSASFLDLLAPGSFIYSSVLYNAFDYFSGTSMATPHVSGAIAVLKAHSPWLSVNQLQRTLKNSGQPITDTKNNITTPRIQLDLALNFIKTLSTATKLHTTPQADLNGDQQADILWRHSHSGENYLYHLEGTQRTASIPINTVADQHWQIAGIGDFNGDDNSDILWRHSLLGINWLYFMQGNQIQSQGQINQVSDLNWQISGIGDFDGDGNSDILWRNKSTGVNWIYLMDGLTIQSSRQLNHVADLNWQIAGVGDFNGDGNSDILWRNKTSGLNWIYLLQGISIQSQAALDKVADLNWKVVGIGDFNDDTHSDILWRHATNGRNHLYFIEGLQVDYQQQINVVANQDWQIKTTGDYNGDGTSDIFWRNDISGENYIYLMREQQIIGRGTVNHVPDLGWQVQSP